MRSYLFFISAVLGIELRVLASALPLSHTPTLSYILNKSSMIYNIITETSKHWHISLYNSPITLTFVNFLSFLTLLFISIFNWKIISTFCKNSNFNIKTQPFSFSWSRSIVFLEVPSSFYSFSGFVSSLNLHTAGFHCFPNSSSCLSL